MSINSILFIDIETVPLLEYYSYDLKEGERFKKRFKNALETPGVDVNEYYSRNAALYAEHSKIVAISIGKMLATKFYVKSLTGRDEKQLLTQFNEALVKATDLKTMCAHNGKEFDFPFLMRRMIINELPVHDILNTVGKKPWDVHLEDTMQMWGGTQWNYKVSLDLLCGVLGVPSPKKEMSGAGIAEIYYGMFEPSTEELPFDKEASALKVIGNYCSGDVVAMAHCYCRMKGIPFQENVEYA